MAQFRADILNPEKSSVAITTVLLAYAFFRFYPFCILKLLTTNS